MHLPLTGEELHVDRGGAGAADPQAADGARHERALPQRPGAGHQDLFARRVHGHRRRAGETHHLAWGAPGTNTNKLDLYEVSKSNLLKYINYVN